MASTHTLKITDMSTDRAARRVVISGISDDASDTFAVAYIAVSIMLSICGRKIAKIESTVGKSAILLNIFQVLALTQDDLSRNCFI